MFLFLFFALGSSICHNLPGRDRKTHAVHLAAAHLPVWPGARGAQQGGQVDAASGGSEVAVTSTNMEAAIMAPAVDTLAGRFRVLDSIYIMTAGANGPSRCVPGYELPQPADIDSGWRSPGLGGVGLLFLSVVLSRVPSSRVPDRPGTGEG
jgi:hypothetical protein